MMPRAVPFHFWTVTFISLMLGCSSSETKGPKQRFDSKKRAAQFIANLSSANKPVRLQAIYAIAQLGAEGKPAIPGLIKLLKHKDWESWAEAAVTLGYLSASAKSAIPHLIENLGDNHSQVRRSASSALAKIGKDAIPALRQALESKAGVHRRYAVKALGLIAPRAQAAIPVLAACLEYESDSVQFELRRIFRQLGPAAIPVLIESLHDKNQVARSNAILILGEIGPKAERSVPALIEMLNGDDKRLRSVVANALAQIGAKARAAIPALIANLSEDESLRYDACKTLISIGQTAVPPLILAAESNNPKVRLEVIYALGRIKHDAKGKTELLIKALRDPDQEVRRFAATAMSSLGVLPKEAIPALMANLKDLRNIEDVKGQLGIPFIHALSEMGMTAVPALLKALREKETHLGAAYALASGGQSRLPILRSCLRDRDCKVRQHAAIALGLMNTQADEAVQDLLQALKDKDSNVRLAALLAITDIGFQNQTVVDLPLTNSLRLGELLTFKVISRKWRDKMSPVLMNSAVFLHALTDNDQRARAQVAKLLAAMGPAAQLAIPALIQALKDQDRVVRINAIQALGAVGSAAKSALPALKNALKDRDFDARLSIKEAISKIE